MTDKQGKAAHKEFNYGAAFSLLESIQRALTEVEYAYIYAQEGKFAGFGDLPLIAAELRAMQRRIEEMP